MTSQSQNIVEYLRQEAQKQAIRSSEKLSNTPNVNEPSKENQPVNSHQRVSQNKPGNIFERASQSNIFQKKVEDGTLFRKGNSINLFTLNTEQQKKTVQIFKDSKPLIENDPQRSHTSNQSWQQVSSHAYKSEPYEKEMKYSYETIKILGQYQVRKFRNGTHPLKEDINIVLCYQPNNKNVIYLQVKSRNSHILVYTGIISNMVKIQAFMGKEENIKMTILKCKQNDNQGLSQLSRETIKIQFQTSQHAKNFENTIKDYFSGNKDPRLNEFQTQSAKDRSQSAIIETHSQPEYKGNNSEQKNNTNGSQLKSRGSNSKPCAQEYSQQQSSNKKSSIIKKDSQDKCSNSNRVE